MRLICRNLLLGYDIVLNDIGEKICDGARILRRPCNCDEWDGVQVRRRLQPIGRLTDGKLRSGALYGTCPAFPLHWIISLLAWLSWPFVVPSGNCRVYFEASIREKNGAWRLVTPFQSTPLAVSLPVQLVCLWMLVWAAKEAWEASRDLPQVLELW